MATRRHPNEEVDPNLDVELGVQGGGRKTGRPRSPEGGGSDQFCPMQMIQGN